MRKLGVRPRKLKHEVYVTAPNGHGSVGTKIRRWSTIVRNIGKAIVYKDDSSAGSSFTIAEDGVYSITYCDFYSGGNDGFCVSLNSTSLSTGASSLSPPEGIAYFQNTSSNRPSSVSFSMRLKGGDVIRPHTDGNADGNNNQRYFIISKVSD
jgi:hypothetical protein